VVVEGHLDDCFHNVAREAVHCCFVAAPHYGNPRSALPSLVSNVRRGADQNADFEGAHLGERGGRLRDEAARPPCFRRWTIRGKALLLSRTYGELMTLRNKVMPHL